MYHFLKVYVVLNDVRYTARPSVRKVSYSLFNKIYPEDADKNRAFELLENPATFICTAPPPTVFTSVHTPATSPTNFDVDKKNRIQYTPLPTSCKRGTVLQEKM